jgi:hypothetical protein
MIRITRYSVHMIADVRGLFLVGELVMARIVTSRSCNARFRGESSMLTISFASESARLVNLPIDSAEYDS